MRVANLQPQDHALPFSTLTFSSLFYWLYGRRRAPGSQAFCLRRTQAVVQRSDVGASKNPVFWEPGPGGKKR